MSTKLVGEHLGWTYAEGRCPKVRSASKQPCRGCTQAQWGFIWAGEVPGLVCSSWAGASPMAFLLCGFGSWFRMKCDHITIYCTPLSDLMSCGNSLYKPQLQQRWHCPKTLTLSQDPGPGLQARLEVQRLWKCEQQTGLVTHHPSPVTSEHLSVPCCPGSQPSSSWEQHF